MNIDTSAGAIGSAIAEFFLAGIMILLMLGAPYRILTVAFALGALFLVILGLDILFDFLPRRWKQ